MIAHEWWDSVSDIDRLTLLAHRARFLLPPAVIAVYSAAGGPPVEPVDDRPGRYRWPASVQAFLFDQAAIDPDCE